jgi:hypothetical protein
MKTILFILVGLSLSVSTLATVRTVSNTPDIAQFTSIQAAIDASADSDTVYVYGSPNPYAGFFILDKKITVIGPGWAPDKNLPLRVVINSAVFIRDSTVPGSPNGSELQGLVLSTLTLSRNQVTGDFPTNNIRLIRCEFTTNISWDLGATGHLFEGCFFGAGSQLFFAGGSTYQNFLFQNNIFFIPGSNRINSAVNSINVRFDHNLFYSNNNGGGGIYQIFNNCSFLTLTNNIFNQTNAGLGLSFSTFNNNIANNITLSSTNAVSNATPWAVNSNVDGGGNIANQNPAMVDQTAVNAGTATFLSNFTIASGPANNSGSDAKDMGLLYDATGSLNWNNSRNSRIPRIFVMNIITPTVAPGTNLSVTVDARKSN